MKKVRLGLIGLGCRGRDMLDTMFAFPAAEITAVCDKYKDRVEETIAKVKKEQGRTPKGCTDYREVLKDDAVDAVFIATSWDTHIRIANDAMKAGKITALEVGGAYTVEECWELVYTYEQTKTPFMFMENCCYGKFELLSLALARAGELGTLVHAHGSYGHDLREEVLGGRVNRHYRLENYLKRNCENYPTHELGPIAKILDINRGNRMLSLVSVASKAAGLEEFSYTEKNPDQTLRGQKFAQGDIVNTIITCANGETISLKLDTTLPRYYSREFTLRGTKGLCCQEANMVFLEKERNVHEFCEPFETLQKYMGNTETYQEYIPECWKTITEEEKSAGHGGMDYLMFKDFFAKIESGEPFALDVYDAASWMSVTALSEESVAKGGMPVSIPDFTCGKWINRERIDIWLK